MRWKERFLVPDHRVGNISGAGFAGFYYMCLALCEEGMSSEQENFPVPASTLSDESDMSENDLWSLRHSRMRPVHSSVRAPSSLSHRGQLNGFYFHVNSEPYVQYRDSMTDAASKSYHLLTYTKLPAHHTICDRI